MATLKANKRTDFKRSTLQKIRHSGPPFLGGAGSLILLCPAADQ